MPNKYELVGARSWDQERYRVGLYTDDDDALKNIKLAITIVASDMV